MVLDRTPISYLTGTETVFATPRLLAPPYHWTILPGLGNNHDLIELLELAHPRRVLLTHPLDAAQQPSAAMKSPLFWVDSLARTGRASRP